MNDPHVERLRYKLLTPEWLTFQSPQPVVEERELFHCQLKDDLLVAEMKEHHATEDGARSRVETFLRAWELATELSWGRGAIKFHFEGSDVIDRNPPPPGAPRKGIVGALGVVLGAATCVAIGHLSRSCYPAAPTRFVASPDVEMLWSRFQQYLDGKEPLLSMANACMTYLQGATGATSNERDAFCRTYHVELAVRKKLGDIVSLRGGPMEARKLDLKATKTPLTGGEKQWVENVIKALIRRKGEFDADPENAESLPQIMLADFNPL